MCLQVSLKLDGPGKGGAPEHGLLFLNNVSVEFTAEATRANVTNKLSSIREARIARPTDGQADTMMCRVLVSGFVCAEPNQLRFRRKYASVYFLTCGLTQLLARVHARRGCAEHTRV